MERKGLLRVRRDETGHTECFLKQEAIYLLPGKKEKPKKEIAVERKKKVPKKEFAEKRSTKEIIKKHERK